MGEIRVRRAYCALGRYRGDMGEVWGRYGGDKGEARVLRLGEI